MRVQVTDDTVSRISNAQSHRDMLMQRHIPDMSHKSIGDHLSLHIRSREHTMSCLSLTYQKKMDVVVLHDRNKEVRHVSERVKKMKI